MLSCTWLFPRHHLCLNSQGLSLMPLQFYIYSRLKWLVLCKDIWLFHGFKIRSGKGFSTYRWKAVHLSFSNMLKTGAAKSGWPIEKCNPLLLSDLVTYLRYKWQLGKRETTASHGSNLFPPFSYTPLYPKSTSVIGGGADCRNNTWQSNNSISDQEIF